MISNPQKAIENSHDVQSLADVLYDIMARFYPNADWKGWKEWAEKYATIDIAKEASWRMYKRLRDGKTR